MSLMTPPWPYSAVQVLRVINTELALRLNSSPSQMGPAWIVESGQMALSKPGSFRVVWSLQGGPVEKGFQFHGPDMTAPGIATRLCRLEAKIQALNPNVSGITDETIKAAEDVIRALIIVWQQKKPADYDDMQESWDEFTASPGQPMVVAKLSVVPKLCVLGDEYLFKIIDEVQSSGVLNNA